jgi:hypothetical protein
MDHYAVCVLPGRRLRTQACGLLEVPPDLGRKTGGADRKRRIAYREIWDISNLDENGGIRGAHERTSPKCP